MGQLEKYGLYVLVVVIFLILGVAIWGGDSVERDDLASIGDGTVAQAATMAGRPLARAPEDASRIDPGAMFVDLPVNRAGGGSTRDAARGQFVDAPSTADGAASDDPAASRRVPVSEPEVQDAVRIHRVRRGDTFTSIAKQYYGDANLHHLVAEANPDLKPRELREGTEVKVPPRPAADRQGSAAPDAPREAAVAGSMSDYIVQPNDSLSRISKKLFGTEAHWRALADYNGLSESSVLQLQQRIRIPPELASQRRN